MRKFSYVLIVLGVLFFSSCGEQAGDKEVKKLVIGFTGGDDPTERMSHMKLLAAYFQRETGVKKVEYFIASDYAAVIEAMRAKKVDIAHLGELSYLLAVDRAGAEAFAMLGTVDGDYYTSSVIITGTKSGITSMEEVKRKAKDLTFTFGDPASTSGHLLPRAHLNSIGLPPEESFKQVSFSNSYAAAVLTTIAGRVDISCTFGIAMDRFVKQGRISREDYIVLWESEPYRVAPISIRGDLPEELKKKVQDAYVNIHINEPELWSNYRQSAYALYDEELRDKFIYLPAHDSMYTNIKEIANTTEGFSLNLQ